MAARVKAWGDDGSEVDITAPVASMYDAIINSMDWGSGFLSTEEIIDIIKVGKACGFEMPYTKESAIGLAPRCRCGARHQPGTQVYIDHAKWRASQEDIDLYEKLLKELDD